jgi:hypothetical protein
VHSKKIGTLFSIGLIHCFFGRLISPLSIIFLTKPALATQFAPQGNQAEQGATEQRNGRAHIGNTYYRRSGLGRAFRFTWLPKKNRGHCDHHDEEFSHSDLNSHPTLEEVAKFLIGQGYSVSYDLA